MEHDEFGLHTSQGSVRPTSTGKPGRFDNTGVEVKLEVGRPHDKSHAAIATQRRGRPRSRQVSRSRAVAAEGGSTHDRGRRGRRDQGTGRTQSG